MVEAYCGPAPQPQALLAAWNADAVALALCGALVATHLAAGPRKGRLPLACAVAVLLVLFVSPLCALTVALFSARVAHHVLLVAVAAPLLALAFPQRRPARRLSSSGRWRCMRPCCGCGTCRSSMPPPSPPRSPIG